MHPRCLQNGIQASYKSPLNVAESMRVLLRRGARASNSRNGGIRATQRLKAYNTSPECSSLTVETVHRTLEVGAAANTAR